MKKIWKITLLLLLPAVAWPQKIEITRVHPRQVEVQAFSLLRPWLMPPRTFSNLRLVAISFSLKSLFFSSINKVSFDCAIYVLGCLCVYVLGCLCVGVLRCLCVEVIGVWALINLLIPDFTACHRSHTARHPFGVGQAWFLISDFLFFFISLREA